MIILHAFFDRKFFALFIVPLLFACGSGNPDSSTDDSLVDDSVSTETEIFNLATRVEGEAIPGQSIQFLLSGDHDETAGVEWIQTGGPTVSLELTAAGGAQFRVPPVNRNTAFSFRVSVTDKAGNVHRLPLRVLCKAISWKDLEVVETQLIDNFVVFRANKDNSLRTDLYRADLDGNNIIRLNGPLVPGGNVRAFAISPDGQQVAYLADEEKLGVLELFSVETAGGTSLRISGEPVAGGNVSAGFAWAPDSSRLAYRADQESDEVYELFVAYPGPTPAARLSGDMTVNGDVSEANFFWSDDSQRIVYRANQLNDNTLELFVSDADGLSNQRISAPPTAGGGVLGNFAWMPGGRRIAYIADLDAAGVFELFAVNDDGSESMRISGPLVAAGSVLDFAWAPDASRIAYRAEQLSAQLIELYSVRPDGSDNTLLSAVTGDADVSDFAWAPNAEAIAYLADQLVDERIELFVTGPDGSANRRVSGAMVSNGDVSEFAWAPDSSYLAYRADQNVDGVMELFTSTPDAAASTQVSGAMINEGDVYPGWLWSSDSRWIAYRADQRFDSVAELFSAAPDGSVTVLASGSLVSGGNVESLQGQTFVWSTDSTRLIYAADQYEDGKYELFVTSPDSGVAIVSISGLLTAGGDVLDFALAGRPVYGDLQLVDIPNPATVFNSPLDCYAYSNNLASGIWHRPSDQIIAGHFSSNGYYAHPAGSGGYPEFPDNDVGTRYNRMVHMPLTNTVVRSGPDQFPNPSSEIFVGTIDPITGDLFDFAPAEWSNGFNGDCNMISSSASEFMCLTGNSVRIYDTEAGSAALTFNRSVTFSQPLTNNCNANCFGGTFAWDGAFFYFASGPGSSSSTDYEVFDGVGNFVSSHTADGSGNINSVYFDWSAAAYATHDGFGIRQGINNFFWEGGTFGNDSQCYTLSTAHALP